MALTVPRARLQVATVRIQNLRDGAAEALDANVAGTGLSKSYSAGVLRLQGSASPAVYETVLRSVTYRNNAAAPDTANRTIAFTVNDGFADSNTAVSTIRILFLRLELDVSPATQTIASGGTAVFTVAVRNSGNVTLNTVPLRSDADDDCDRTWNSITPGTTRRISCSATGVTADLINRFTVTATAGGTETSAAASARVEVDNPNIRIVKSPSTQTVLAGEPARFNIFVLNPSTRVNLGEVTVSDPLAPACSREGAAGLGNLPAGAQETYSCASAAVSAAFTNVITVTGRNLFTGSVVSDSSVAAVELLDMQPVLQVDPALLSAPGGPVVFALTAVNSGSLPWTLTGLDSPALGNLLNPANTAAQDNTCAELPQAAIAPGEQFSCTFTAVISGAGGPQSVALALTAADSDGLALSKQVSATITIGEDTLLETTLSAATDSVPPDGQFRARTAHPAQYRRLTSRDHRHPRPFRPWQPGRCGHVQPAADHPARRPLRLRLRELHRRRTRRRNHPHRGCSGQPAAPPVSLAALPGPIPSTTPPCCAICCRWSPPAIASLSKKTTPPAPPSALRPTPPILSCWMTPKTGTIPGSRAKAV